jgi:DNA-binding response OmpR family regulator
MIDYRAIEDTVQDIGSQLGALVLTCENLTAEELPAQARALVETLCRVVDNLVESNSRLAGLVEGQSVRRRRHSRPAEHHLTELPPEPRTDNIIRVGRLEIDLTGWVVTDGDRDVRLTLHQFRALAVLAENSGKWVKAEHIASRISNSADAASVNALRTMMAQVRRRLDPGVDWRFSRLQSGRHLGYRLVPTVSNPQSSAVR